MDTKVFKTTTMLVLGVISVSVLAMTAWAKAPAIDPVAVQTLEKMTSYMANLERFSLHTENTIEETLDNGQRIDLDISASMLVRRPDKLLAERVGEDTEQVFYYDGQSLTMFVSTPAEAVYASIPVPGTIEQMVDVAREQLGIVLPASDLVYRNAQSILMTGVTSATIVGETVIGDMVCTHLAFRRPDMDFQIWVAAGPAPVPCKYVVTDTSMDKPLSIVTVMSNWNLAPHAADTLFKYTPTEEATSTTFLQLDSESDD